MTNIDHDQLAIIMQSRKTLLFYDNDPWVKKTGDEGFDVTMGCNDGAEICETVGIYMLSRLNNIMKRDNIGLYRDDGLGICQNMSKTEIERMKKSIVKIFKDSGLSITIKCNLKSVDFLDVTFDLKNNTYKPYRKPNNKPQYINKHSNHAPNVLKQLPKSIEKRISENSSNIEVFNQSITLYKDALRESNFSDNLQYKTPTTKNIDEENQKRKRKRNIIWFNPPYSKNVKTNIGKTFLQLVSKHFPKTHDMHKIFNKNTVKISYSCMRNIGSILSTHNKNILKPNETSFGCNCRNKTNCPLNSKCKITNIIYRADITTANDHKFYYGTSETNFKQRHNNHSRDFKYLKYQHCTELAKYIWQLKNNNICYNIKWSIVSKVYGYASSLNCKLCLMEKYCIIKDINNPDLLNKKSELINKCRHVNKILLKNVYDRVNIL